MKKQIIFSLIFYLCVFSKIYTQGYATDSNTVLLMHMNETSGSTVADFSGLGNNGTTTGTTIVTGKYENARSFPNQFDGVVINQNLLNSMNVDFTFEAWVYPMEYANSTHRRALFNQRNTADGAPTIELTIGTLYSSNGTKNISFVARDDDWNMIEYYGTSEIPLNEWTHLAVVRDATNGKIYCYVNGNIEIDVSLGNFGTQSGFNTFVIGRNAYAPAFDYFAGRIDEVRISNKARQPFEFNLPDGNSMFAYYPFTGGSTDDSSGNGNNATNYSASPAADRFGSENCAYNFNGENNYMTTPLNREEYENFSVALWYKYNGSTNEMYKALIASDSGDFFIGKNSRNTDIRVMDFEEYDDMATGTNAWDGNWHFITYTLDDGNGKLYVDAQLVGNENFSGGAGMIWFGHQNVSNGYYFNGVLDDIRLYNYAISENDINALYNANNWGSFVITTSVEGYGSITPDGDILLPSGASQQFLFEPDNGNHVDSVFVDGFSVDSLESYTFENIYSNHSIMVKFALDSIMKFRTFKPADGLGNKAIQLKYKRDKLVKLPNEATAVEAELRKIGKTKIAILGVQQFSNDNIKKYSWCELRNDKGKGGEAVSKLFLSSHSGSAFPLDSVRKNGKAKKIKGAITPDYKNYNNVEIEQGVLFKLNLLASRDEILPFGFGALVFNKDVTVVGRQLKGRTLSQIGSLYDSMMTYYENFGIDWFNGYEQLSIMVESVLRPTNEVFMQDIDSTNFIITTDNVKRNPYAIKLRGVKTAFETGFLLQVSKQTQPLQSGVTALKPNNFSLEQNYPNPFNPVTNIRFTLNDVRITTLKVYDVLGREVAVLLNNEMLEAGAHEVPFDATHLSSGVYFYKLIAGDFSETKKMLLMK